MKYLLAKTKNKTGQYFKVLTDQNIFNLPNSINDSVEYGSDYKLDDQQWFKIESFTSKEYCDDFLKKDFVSAEYTNISQENFKNISHFVSVEKNDYLFQKISPSHLLRKRYIALNSNPEIIKESSLIPIPYTMDAYYNKGTDTLYFKKLSRITTIFKGIDSIYREATQEETVEFLSNPFLSLKNDFNATKVKKANRKRIALAMNTLNAFKPKEKKTLLKYIGGYCKDLKFSKKKQAYTIESEEDLKQLLFGIEQRYYTTQIGGEKRVANSILKIE